MSPRAIVVGFATLAANASARAQQTIPVRALTPATASDSGVLKAVSGLRALPGGRVMINDPTQRRLLIFDSTMKQVTIIADTAAGAKNPYGSTGYSAGLIPFAGDSTLFADRQSQAFIVIDANGNFGRVMSAPKASDLSYMAGEGSGFDPKGRMIYRGYRRPPPPKPGSAAAAPAAPLTPGGGLRIVDGGPDSAPVVRIDFETRQVDTLGMMKIVSPRMAMMPYQSSPGSTGMSIRVVQEFNPLPLTDEWALLPDGTVAIVRGLDFHVDWISPDDTKRSSPKMPFDWKRITLEDKQQIIDSIKQARADADAKLPAPVAGAVGPPRMPLLIVEPSALPDYYPSVRAGQVKADVEGQLWVLPATSTIAQGGLLFDVINRDGAVVERVQLPAGRNLLGFGPGGVVYLGVVTPSGGTAVLERARVVRGTPVKP